MLKFHYCVLTTYRKHPSLLHIAVNFADTLFSPSFAGELKLFCSQYIHRKYKNENKNVYCGRLEVSLYKGD